MTTRTPRPVFVMGPARSGAALVAWALGQHSAFSSTQTTPWFHTLAPQLHAAHEQVTEPGSRASAALRGVPAAEFLRPLAVAAERLALGNAARSGRRWVDHTPDAALGVAVLAELYPEARFLHVVRELDETIQLLTTNDVSKLHGAYFSPPKAYEHWLQITRACVAAEAAMGPERVRRIHYRDLVTDPRATLEDCLSFLGAGWEDRCIRPLQSVQPARDVVEPEGVSKYRVRREAKELFATIESSPQPAEGDPELMATMGAAITGRAATERRIESRHGPFHGLVDLAADATARVLVASRGDDDLLAFTRTTGLHFPATADGRYAGFHPKDSAAAILLLEEARAAGATHLAFPTTSAWWLDHYGELRSFLAQEATVAAYAGDVGIVFDLGARSEGASPLVWQPVVSTGEDAVWDRRVRELEEAVRRLDAEEDDSDLLYWATEALQRAGLDPADTVVVHHGSGSPGPAVTALLPRRAPSADLAPEPLLRRVEEERVAGARHAVLLTEQRGPSGLEGAFTARYPQESRIGTAVVYRLAELVAGGAS
jgi:hypothetical protein